MTTTITFHGVACFEVKGPSGRILFDPYLDGNIAATIAAAEIAPPDLLLVSHAPFDHVGDAARIAIRAGCPVVCGSDCARLLVARGVPAEQICQTVWGVDLEVAGFRVHPVESRHWSTATLPDGSTVSGPPLGFVVESEAGARIYHSGDSALFDGMALIGRFYRPDVALLCCAQPASLATTETVRYLTGEMSPDQAAYAAELLGVRYAVAAHYETPDQSDIVEFLRKVPEYDSSGTRTAVALESGRSLTVVA